MAQPISKTTFLSFLKCDRNEWMRIHKPNEVGKSERSDFELYLIKQGNEVEAAARKLFPKGVPITEIKDAAVEQTKQLMATRTPTIFQATFVVDGFIAKSDILVYDKGNNQWMLYEVKGTSAINEGNAGHREHIDDLAFQLSVLRRAGVSVDQCFVIHLNKKYVRSGDIDLSALFKTDDLSEKVEARLPFIEGKMTVAKQYLGSTIEPAPGCACLSKARKKHCASFQLSNPQVPAYSIHDISRIGQEKLDLLVARGIFDLNDIPNDFDLTDRQKKQVLAHKQQKPMIDRVKIKAELDALAFPLYFFDYEAFGPAIPAFDGFGPYKHIPFQFSLHILRSRDAALEHIEFLHESLTDPSEEVVASLKRNIPTGGTVIAWYKPFEQMVNKEIGTRLPEHAEYFEEFNARIYDLMEIFSDQHYVHHGFKGSSSIKKVLETLELGLRYDSLDIREGGQAAGAWWRMVQPETPAAEKAKIAHALKDYCGVDTLAMYLIWRHLQETTAD